MSRAASPNILIVILLMCGGKHAKTECANADRLCRHAVPCRPCANLILLHGLPSEQPNCLLDCDGRVCRISAWVRHERRLDSPAANGRQRQPARKKPYANILTVSANRYLAIIAPYLLYGSAETLHRMHRHSHYAGLLRVRWVLHRGLHSSAFAGLRSNAVPGAATQNFFITG